MNYKINKKSDDFNSLLVIESSETVNNLARKHALSASDYLLEMILVEEIEKTNKLYYDINSMVSIKDMMSYNNFSFHKAEKLIYSLVQLQQKLIANLVPLENIVLDINYIYYNLATKSYSFLFLPFDVKETVYKTKTFVLEVKDYFETFEMEQGEFIAELALYVMGENYTLKGLHNIVDKNFGQVEPKKTVVCSQADSLEIVNDDDLFQQTAGDELEYVEYGCLDELDDDFSYIVEDDSGQAISQQSDAVTGNDKKYLLIALAFEIIYNLLAGLTAVQFSKSFESPLSAAVGIFIIMTVVNIVIFKHVFSKVVDFSNVKLLFGKNKAKQTMQDKVETFENGGELGYIDIAGLDALAEENKTVMLDSINSPVKKITLLRKDINQQYVLDKPKSLIGRSRKDADVYVEDDTVGRNHAIISLVNGNFYIKDLGSLNGTFLNRRRLKKDRSKEIKNGDIIKISKVKFKVLM